MKTLASRAVLTTPPAPLHTSGPAERRRPRRALPSAGFLNIRTGQPWVSAASGRLTHADARRDVAQVDMPRAGEMADGRAEVSITSAQQGEEDIERAEQGAGDLRDAA